ncbi:hypothetical protein Lal_00028042 [Lupinus albus]|nr:hypothetical protein Lal_00028042 [Lupinus albus]
MAIANKFLALLIFVLLIISLLQTLVMASQGHGSHHYDNKSKYGPGSLKSYQCPSHWCTRPSTTNPACFSVRSAVGSACVYPRGIMGIKLCALVTTTGRPNKEVLSALKTL